MRHPELEQLRAPFVRHEDGLGTNVGVHQVAGVALGQRVRDVYGQLDGAPGRNRTPGALAAQVHARRELVREIASLVVFADVEQRRDVGVRELRRRPSILQEFLAHAAAAECLVANQPQRDGAAELRVPRAIDLAERPLAEALEQVVVGDGSQERSALRRP